MKRLSAVVVALGVAAAGCSATQKQLVWQAVETTTADVCPFVVRSTLPQFADLPICATVEEVEQAIQSFTSGGARARESVTSDEVYAAILAKRAAAKAAK